MDLKSQPISNSGQTKKKSNRAMQIFKLSLFMLRRRSKKSKASVDMGSDKGLWQRLLASIRPLHIEDNESPPTIVHTSLAPKPKEVYEESPIPLSSSPSSSFSSSTLFSCTSMSSSFCTRQHASEPNLQELDNDSESDNDENTIDGGDEMIDAKADEFIAQFYEQMRRQQNGFA
ncbi:hypothetical protein SDJN03_26429, partial [Cucurbita argyrosperma subsp. sororia]